MKKIIFLFAFLGCLFVATPMQAQLRFGIKAGANISKIDLSGGWKTNNVTGFTAGIMSEFIVPVVGIGADASLMYVRRGYSLKHVAGTVSREDAGTKNMDYIDIPLNLKWKGGLPFVKFFATAGPNFSFLVNSDLPSSEKRKFDVGLNVGAGIELVQKIQIAVNHNWGLTNAIDIPEHSGKNRGWTITAAFLF